MKKLDITKEQVWDIIKPLTHDNAVRSKEIETRISVTGSEVRDAIKELRREGRLVGIISNKTDQQGGYYHIHTLTQLQDTIDNLQGRINSMQATVRALEQHKQDFDSSGQLTLF